MERIRDESNASPHTYGARLGEGGNSLAYFSLAEQREVKKG